MKYTIFKKQTGEIVKIIQCNLYDLNLNVKEDEDYIQGDFDDLKYYIDTKKKMPVKKETQDTDNISLLIREEMSRILYEQNIQIRKQAIQNLKKQEKIPVDYKEDKNGTV